MTSRIPPDALQWSKLVSSLVDNGKVEDLKAQAAAAAEAAERELLAELDGEDMEEEERQRRKGKKSKSAKKREKKVEKQQQQKQGGGGEFVAPDPPPPDDVVLDHQAPPPSSSSSSSAASAPLPPSEAFINDPPSPIIPVVSSKLQRLALSPCAPLDAADELLANEYLASIGIGVVPATTSIASRPV